MNKRDQGRVEALERRRSHLLERLTNWDRGNPSRTQQELAALDWALRVIVVAEDAGLMPLVRQDELIEQAMRGTED